MMGLNGWLLVLALVFVAAPIGALTVGWWAAPVCLVLAFIAFACFPMDLSKSQPPRSER